MTNLKCKFRFFATQNGKSRDPNSGCDPLFADPWARLVVLNLCAEGSQIQI